MPDKTDVLRSLSDALDKLPDDRWNYLIGYAEGIIAARQVQPGA